MRFPKSKQVPSRRNTARPQVEALESRWCPAVVKVSGSLLQVVGDGLADTMALSDDGNGGFSVQVKSPKGNISASASGITKVDIDAGNGNDTISYTLAKALVSARTINLTAYKGNDTISLDFSAGVSGAPLKIDADTGTGSSQVSVKFGAVTNKSKVDFEECLGAGGTATALDMTAGIDHSKVETDFEGGKGNHAITAKFGDIKASDFVFMACLDKGNQTLNVSQNGEISGKSPAQFNIGTGNGNDFVRFQGVGQIDAGATLDIDQGACMGSKNVNVAYDGVIKGSLQVGMNSGKSAGTLVANLTAEAGSTGNIWAREKGSPGNDNLTLNVFDNTGAKSTLASLDALINGDGGTDTIVHTSNVKVKK
jgi:hypothetical protein